MKLREIWQAYDLYSKDYKKPPTKTADLLRYAVALSSLDESLKASQFVVQWGVSLASPPDRKAILAYPKDAPSQGGHVLLADGAIRKMSAQEFSAAPKAK